MDPQDKQPTGAAPTEDVKPNEVSVDLAQASSAQPPAEPDPATIAFKTDSDGTVQAVAPTDTPAATQPDEAVSPVTPSVPAETAAPVAAEPSAADVPAPVAADATATPVEVAPQPIDPTQPQAAIPPVAPTPAPQKSMAMLLALSVVAVVLIAAIAAMLVL